MGLLSRSPAILFIILAASITGFAIAVHKIPTAHEFYERRIKEHLEEAEYIFNWLGTIYFVLPMVAFAVVQDWTKIFFDCFHPFSLWSDALYSAIVVIQLVTFVREIGKNTGRIAIEYGGVPVQLSCVFAYTMLKRSNDNFDLYLQQAQNIFALGFVLVFGFLTFLQLQFKYEVPDGYEGLAWAIARCGMLLQALQPLSSLFCRALKGNFDDDEPATMGIKLSAAILRMCTSLYDLWVCSSNGYWYSPYKEPFAAMILFSFYTSCVLVVYRYIGPRKLKAGYDGVVACILRRLTATKDCIAKTCVDIKAWLQRTGSDIKNSLELLCTWVEAWVKIQRAKKALAAAERRNAGLSQEEHFSAPRV